MCLLLVQLPSGRFLFHYINIALQLVDTLLLTLLHETPYEKKQKENHKSDHHLTPFSSSNERINVYLTERYDIWRILSSKSSAASRCNASL